MRAVCNAAMALVLWLCVTIPALSAGEFEKPGALAQSLALPDGSPVHFTGLLVDRVVAFPPYAVVRDGQNPNERLIVLFPAPPGLRRWQTVDVAGVLTTLPNGYRAVDRADVTFYTDAMGVPFQVPIPAAGHETAWPFAALTEFFPLAARGEGQARLTESEELPTPEEPPYVAPQATVPEPGTIPYALAQTDTTQVALSGKTVTAVLPNENPPCFYIQEDDRCAGIKVVPLAMPWNLQRGDRVDLNFSVSTDSNDERILLQESSQYLFTHTHGYGLMPLTMSTRSLWCGPASEYTTAVEVGGVAGNGIYAIGQLVRIGGTVTAVDPQGTWFTISDGAATFLNGAIADEIANPGIRVQNAEDYTVQVGDDVLVAGVAGLRKVGANVYPVLRALPCPSWDLVLRPAHVVIGHCDTESVVTATLLECGKPAANRQVEFVTSSPLAFEGVSGAVTYATTDAAGKATVTVERAGPVGYGEGNVSAFYGTGSGTAAAAPVSVVLDEWRLQIETAHFWIYQNEQYSVTAKLTRLDGVPVASRSVTLHTDTGLFNGTSAQYTAETDVDGEISATLVIGDCPGTATLTATTDVPPCNDPITRTKPLQVLCPNDIPHADVYLCIDTSDSMGVWTSPEKMDTLSVSYRKGV